MMLLHPSTLARPWVMNVMHDTLGNWLLAQLVLGCLWSNSLNIVANIYGMLRLLFISPISKAE